MCLRHVRWQERPQLNNFIVLRDLRTLLDSGQIRKTAVAIMAFDSMWGDDVKDLVNLRQKRWVSWEEEVHVHEYEQCMNSTAPLLRRLRGLCNRARNGKFHIAAVPLLNVSLVTKGHRRVF